MTQAVVPGSSTQPNAPSPESRWPTRTIASATEASAPLRTSVQPPTGLALSWPKQRHVGALPRRRATPIAAQKTSSNARAPNAHAERPTAVRAERHELVTGRVRSIGDEAEHSSSQQFGSPGGQQASNGGARRVPGGQQNRVFRPAISRSTTRLLGQHTRLLPAKEHFSPRWQRSSPHCVSGFWAGETVCSIALHDGTHLPFGQ